MAHKCGSEEDIFILDPIRKEAWALDIENEKERTKGAFLERNGQCLFKIGELR